MRLPLFLGALLGCLNLVAADSPPLELRKGDHVAVVGSGVADRQQHHGWLESLLHAAHPGHRLVVRNLGFAGDEVTFSPRSDGTPPLSFFLNMTPGTLKARWGSAEGTYHVGAHFHASVLLAHWGFNESFKGRAGLDAFRANLDKWVKAQLAADHGQGKPRLVLVTPLSYEEQSSADVTLARSRNVELALYATVITEVAKANALHSVDLFSLSQSAFAKSTQPLTHNGIHLTDAGDKALAPAVYAALLGRSAPASSYLAAIRQAVLAKNDIWLARYRVVDQFNTFGQRSRIPYPDYKDKSKTLTNAHILNQELAQRDVQTANRDIAVWAAAQGRQHKVIDDNLPKVDLTHPNLPPRPYISGEETIKHLRLADGCKVELVADEVSLPDLSNPVQMAFDAKGRLWVAVWPTYPSRRPTDTFADKLLVLDLDPVTGKVTKSTVFLDGLNCPTGFQFHKDGVLVVQAPDLIFARDTDGDGKADTFERILHNLDAADSHHQTNSISREPGGAIYLSDGVFHRTNVETPWGPVSNVDGAIYRFEPMTGRFYRHVPLSFANPHGKVFDRWGNDLVTDGTGNHTYFAPAVSGFREEGKHPGFPEFWKRPARPCAGTTILSSRHFPDDWQGIFLNLNVIGYQGIFRARISEDGAGLKGETLPQGLLWADVANAPNFRPVSAAVAPDGSVYVLDWAQQLIGHLQHHIRDPNRDKTHGRIYRVTYPSRPLLKPKAIAGQPIPVLLDLLKEPEDNVRERTRIELEGRPSQQVLAALGSWLSALDRKHPDFEHHRLEALWVHQTFNSVNLDLLKAVLASPEPRARAQAVRVLGYWRDQVPSALALLEVAASDPHPRVKLEVARVCSFFRDEAAAKAAAIVRTLAGEKERHIAYVVTQTVGQLKRFPAAAEVLKGAELAPKPAEPPAPKPANPGLSQAELALFTLGREVYNREAHCGTCHQADGKGLDPAFPPLTDIRWVGGSDERLIKLTLKGLYGPIEVHGKGYGPARGTPPMTGFESLLNDREIAAVLTYIRQSFGNNLSPIKPEQVAKVRAAEKSRNGFWDSAELLRQHPLEKK
jgi:mono/diheme cytochrome c family protein/glucose/arabinose dehydrogenase